MEQRTCPVCRENFTATKNNQRFCPPAPGKAKSKCKTAYTNAKSRGTLDKLLAKPWTPPTPFDCAHCGKRCIPGDNVARHAVKFCGKSCKRAWHAADEEGAGYRWEREQRARRRRERRQARARKRLGRPTVGKIRSFIAGECAAGDCDQTFVASEPQSRFAHYCSRRCQRREAARRRATRYGWNESNRARARRYGTEYEPVRVDKVFERDGYRCGICGEPTIQSAKVPHPNAPTLDHIVPMSAGGPHTYANVQCACFICNSRKGDRIAGGQMILVGCG